jgi:hypothetical protein
MEVMVNLVIAWYVGYVVLNVLSLVGNYRRLYR